MPDDEVEVDESELEENEVSFFKFTLRKRNSKPRYFPRQSGVYIPCPYARHNNL